MICKETIIEVNTNNEDLFKGVSQLCSKPKEILINVIPSRVKIGITIQIDGAASRFKPCSNILLKPIVNLINIKSKESEAKNKAPNIPIEFTTKL